MTKQAERPTVLLDNIMLFGMWFLSILYCVVTGASCHHRNLQLTGFSTQMLQT